MPIKLLSTSSPINAHQRNTVKRNTVIKRTHFPLSAFNASTIQKAQGGTYSEVVYHYEKRHDQDLVYVALSRVTGLNGLYIVSEDGNKQFYHTGCRVTKQTQDLRIELERLSLNPLITITDEISNFIMSQRGFSMISFNVQSLRTHSEDISASLTKSINTLVLCETNLRNNEQINIPNFHCVSRQKHSTSRYGGVAILKNNDNSLRVHSEMQAYINNMSVSQTTASESAVGDFCAAICQLDENRKLVIASIYIQANQKINDVMDFLGFHLAPFATSSAQIFRSREIYSRMPVFLSGDFNTDFKKEESAPLIEYLREVFNLEMINDRNIPTTRYGTTIDAVFTRYIEKIECKSLFTYFSYHKILVTFINCETHDEGGNC